MPEMDWEGKSALWNGSVVNYVPGTLFLTPKKEHKRKAYELIYLWEGKVIWQDEMGELEVSIPPQKTLSIAAELSKSNAFQSIRLCVPELLELT